MRGLSIGLYVKDTSKNLSFYVSELNSNNYQHTVLHYKSLCLITPLLKIVNLLVWFFFSQFFLSFGFWLFLFFSSGILGTRLFKGPLVFNNCIQLPLQLIHNALAPAIEVVISDSFHIYILHILFQNLQVLINFLIGTISDSPESHGKHITPRNLLLFETTAPYIRTLVKVHNRLSIYYDFGLQPFISQF